MTHVARSSQLRRLPLPYLRPLWGPESTVTLVRSDSSHPTHTFPVFLNIVGDPPGPGRADVRSAAVLLAREE